MGGSFQSQAASIEPVAPDRGGLAWPVAVLVPSLPIWTMLDRTGRKNRIIRIMEWILIFLLAEKFQKSAESAGETMARGRLAQSRRATRGDNKGSGYSREVGSPFRPGATLKRVCRALHIASRCYVAIRNFVLPM